MGWFAELIKAYPAMSDEIDRLAALEAKNQQRKMRSDANAAIACNESPGNGRFVKHEGVLWLVRDGKVERAIYCPACETALLASGRVTERTMRCPDCYREVPLSPDEIAPLAHELEQVFNPR